MNERIGDWVETFSGKELYILDPRPDEIDINDMLMLFHKHAALEVIQSIFTA